MFSPQSFQNPVLWEDLPDLEIIRVEDAYYYSASTFACSPGATLLKSYDLVHWEYIGHSVPRIDFGPEYDLDGKKEGAYVLGIWASTIGYRPSSETFYWYGAIQGTERTYIYTSHMPEGPWKQEKPMERFCYDAGIFIDDDDNMYLAYGSGTITVSKLTPDGLGESERKDIFTATDPIEGARMYKINGLYYIWVTKPGDEQRVLKSAGGPFGPYECRYVLVNMRSPIKGSATPHQGSLIDTPDGRWFYMAFTDAYPGGRIPVLAPIEFDNQGWPSVVCDWPDSRGSWRSQYAMPIAEAKHSVNHATYYSQDFTRLQKLGPRWEWNHNPDNTRWGLSTNGLVLKTASVAAGLFLAANTLTHRITGPRSQATFHMDLSGMTDGDRAGAGVFRNESAYIGFHRDGGVISLVYVDSISLNKDWKVASHGNIRTQGPKVEGVEMWLRVKADITPAFSGDQAKETRYTVFEYSVDGRNYTILGPDYLLENTWEWYLGYRFMLLNFATRQLGGHITVRGFELSSWS